MLSPLRESPDVGEATREGVVDVCGRLRWPTVEEDVCNDDDSAADDAAEAEDFRETATCCSDSIGIACMIW